MSKKSKKPKQEEYEDLFQDKPVRKIEVDMWKTSIHSKEIGIKKDEEYRAKARQYTKDMDLIGEMKEDGKSIGNVGIRDSIKDERLVIKLFTDKMNWYGTLEEASGRSIAQSLVYRQKFASFIMIIPRYKYMLKLEKNLGGFGRKETYSFAFFNEEGNVKPFMIEQSRFSIGDDWNVKDATGKRVAHIDGKKFDIGGQWNVSIYHKKLAKETEFFIPLMLFASMRKFEKKIEKRIGKQMKEVKNGKIVDIHKEELSLYENPRSLK